MSELQKWLEIEIEGAEIEKQESFKTARDSYGAGFDAGWCGALKFVLSEWVLERDEDNVPG